jgi:hypothetical protein
MRSGARPAEGTVVIRILSPLPFLVVLGNLLGVQVLVNFGLQRLLTKILVLAGVLNVSGSPAGGPFLRRRRGGFLDGKSSPPRFSSLPCRRAWMCSGAIARRAFRVNPPFQQWTGHTFW